MTWELRHLIALALAFPVTTGAASGQPSAPPMAAGCPLEPLAFHQCALPKAMVFDPPRTSDGGPDMQG